MNKLIAEIFSTLLKVLHVLVVVSLILVVAFSLIKGNIIAALYAVVSFIVYVVVFGFISVVLAMHENLAAMREILEKDSKQVQNTNSMQSAAGEKA